MVFTRRPVAQQIEGQKRYQHEISKWLEETVGREGGFVSQESVEECAREQCILDWIKKMKKWGKWKNYPKTAKTNILTSILKRTSPSHAGLDDDEIEKKRIKFNQLDKDDPVDSSSDEEDDSDEDDTDELLAELAKIKAERAEEEARKQAELQEQNERLRSEKILHANPLMDIAGKLAGEGGGADDFTVKRRWDDDVVFKNCAKSEDHKEEKRFVNDTLRSDFHRRFIERYFSNGSNFISP